MFVAKTGSIKGNLPLMHRSQMKILLLAFFVLHGWLHAQETTVNHPELEWYTITTGHFQIHYHAGAERTAQTVARIAEDIYPPITTLYNWQPDGLIHFIVRDHDDNSNGAAFYYDNKVEIWAPQMTFILRGTHNWLRNVVTHEFSHMISLGASRKLPRKLPAAYLQWISYEKEKRSDVLYGYPNVIASYPLPMTIVPMWLAEGLAQYQIPGLQYDLWDTHRDMLIRTAVLAGEQLTFSEMGVFGKNSLGNERTYNAGYALTRYIAHNWGPSSLQKLTQCLRRPLSFTVDGAIKEVTGLRAGDLYAKWQEEMRRYYQQRTAIVTAHRLEGTVLTPEGIGNTYPAWSPEGKQLAFCGSKAGDYLSLTHLQIYDMVSGKSRVVKSGVNSQLSWSADGGRLLYARIERGKHGSHYSDLYSFDLKKKKEKRLTHGLRAFDPDLSADGQHIVCVTQKDGSENLLLLRADGKLEKPLTRFNDGEGLSAPRWSPSGDRIAFSKTTRHGRNLMLYEFNGDSLKTLIQNQGDARDPQFTADGRTIWFSWDRTGIFNIYSLDLASGAVQLRTNVLGGAFMPSYSPLTGLAFSSFLYDGYKIARLTSESPVDENQAFYASAENEDLLGLDEPSADPSLANIRNYDDAVSKPLESRPYEMTYGQVSFLPRVMVDYNTVKWGSYFYASDILDRYSMFGGASLNIKFDLDAFAIFEMRRFAPTWFVELYAFTRHISRRIEVLEDLPKTRVDIGFNILEADIGARYPLADGQWLRAAFAHSRYTSQIGEFFYRGSKWVSPQNTYFIGNQFSLTWNLDQVARKADSDINPSSGRRMEIQYSCELNRFFEDFATDNKYNTPQEIYTHYDYHRLELNWREYHAMPWSRRHALTSHLRAGWIDRPVDGFFDFFAGGLPGLRGYPFYSIEGRKMLLGRFTYRLPLFNGWQKRFLHLTSDRAALSAFFEYGNAFNTPAIQWGQFKRDAGVSLRFSAFSFYGFPTAFEVTSAYGFNRIENEGVRYGREWRHYITLLFDFVD